MTPAVAFFGELRALGVMLMIENGRLVFDAPAGVLSDSGTLAGLLFRSCTPSRLSVLARPLREPPDAWPFDDH